MVDPVRRADFSKGANNRHRAGALPPGFFREAVNFDPQVGGELALRAGYESIYEGTAVRGALVLGSKVLVADGDDLVELDLLTNSSRVLRTIAGAGPFAGAVHNAELFFCTANESLRYDGSTVRAWGVPTPSGQPAPAVAAGGALLAGVYKFVTTFVDAAGDEGGASIANAFVVAADGSKATFTLPTPPSGGAVRLYASFNNGTTLYEQAQLAAGGAVVLTKIADNTAVLATQFATPPPQGEFVTAHLGGLIIGAGKVVWMTHPLRPHLVYPARGFFQYPVDVTMVEAVEGGVYVGADKTYWIQDVASDTPRQDGVDPSIPVRGTSSLTPDGSAVWMTQYGPVVGSKTGALRFLTRDNYVPTVASQGASGIVEHGGNQMVVTTLRGVPGSNPLVAGDYVDAEIIYP